MKFFSAVVSCLFFISFCTTPPPQSCGNFKTGTFSSFSEFAGVNLRIIRKDSTQIEIIEGTQDSLILNVRWLDSCKYELTLLHTTFPNKEMVGKKTTTDIITTNPNYYIFKATMSGVATFQDTMFKFRPLPETVK